VKPVATPAVPKPAMSLMSRVACAVWLPIRLIRPVLSRPSAVTVLAAVMALLPMLRALAFVLVLLRTPPIVRLLPPAPPAWSGSRPTRPTPTIASPPLVGPIAAPFCSIRSPDTVSRPTSAELPAILLALAMRALAPLSQMPPLTFSIWPEANCRRAFRSREMIPVASPSVPKPAISSTFNVDCAVLLPAMLIFPVLTSPAAVTVLAAVMKPLPMEIAFASVPTFDSTPPIVRLLPPGPPEKAPSSVSLPEPLIVTAPVTVWVAPGLAICSVAPLISIASTVTVVLRVTKPVGRTATSPMDGMPRGFHLSAVAQVCHEAPSSSRDSDKKMPSARQGGRPVENLLGRTPGHPASVSILDRDCGGNERDIDLLPQHPRAFAYGESSVIPSGAARSGTACNAIGGVVEGPFLLVLQ